MVWRCLLNFITRCLLAVYEGFIEFCQRGCLVGSHYLVKQNYHPYERRLWLVIYLVCSSYGFYLITYYMSIYSENIYRIVTVDHGPQTTFRYPTLGICETTNAADKKTFLRVERALNNSLYKLYPQLRKDKATHEFIYNMAYQTRLQYGRSKEPMQSYLNHTQNLEEDVGEFLRNYDYRNIINEIIGSCEEVFHECLWLGKPKNCCEIFSEVPSMLGKCFLFNSDQNNSQAASDLIKELQIFAEPYHFKLKFKRLYRIFILNSRDVPENLMPKERATVKANGLEYNMEFTIRPIISDKSLQYLNEKNLRCLTDDSNYKDRKHIYKFESYTTCITRIFYQRQYELSSCVAYPLRNTVSACKLRELAFLEQKDLITPKSMITVNEAEMRQCLANCDNSQYVVENAYYHSLSNPTNETKHMHALDFVFLHFPKTYKKRQVIRQPEDKLVSLSGILGLFVGLSVVSIIEFFYLTCQAFWKTNKNNKKNTRNLDDTHRRCQMQDRKETNVCRGEGVLARATRMTTQYVFQP